MGMFDVVEAAVMNERSRHCHASRGLPGASCWTAWLLLPSRCSPSPLVAALPAIRSQDFDNGAPPVENLTVERTILDQNGIRLLVRAGGSEPMTIAQVQVDAAYWQFTQDSARSDRARRHGLDRHAFPVGCWAKPTR